MNSRTTINLFLSNKTLAIAGVSRNPQKFGNVVFRTLKEKGYRILPINPNTDSIDGGPCFHSIENLPADVSTLLIVTHKHETAGVMQKAIDKGFRHIWIQRGCETEEALQLANENNINLVSKACIMMYADPKGIHKFHQMLAKLFGAYQV
jgi:predicted CoA-binding protein